MNKINYSKELEKRIEEFQKKNEVPKLLLHACCAPCSSHCLEYLREFFDVTVFFYNPNITESEEYHKRVLEEKRLIEAYNKQVDEQDFEGMHSDEHARKIGIIEGEYDPKEYLDAVRGYEDIPEGGERCRKCFELRLRKTAEIAAKEGFEYFTTTLTISPLKNADVLNEVGVQAAEYVNGKKASDGEMPGREIAFLPSDFKKKEGYKRSIELSQKFGLYRQDYCGCGFSKAERERQKA
ncbi:MAG: epoxyqueuosine reductase QueH [Butyrivibrio sp.]|nr:epoxyqueuosine reductase QueH [Butyrivibrio sp.]